MKPELLFSPSFLTEVFSDEICIFCIRIGTYCNYLSAWYKVEACVVDRFDYSSLLDAMNHVIAFLVGLTSVDSCSISIQIFCQIFDSNLFLNWNNFSTYK